MNTWLTENFKIKYPILMAPMFLVTNEQMLYAAAKANIMGAIPALNWRTPEDMEQGMQSLKINCPGPFGINLIVNKSNLFLKDQIKILEKYMPDFIITSLGSPQEVIKRLKHNKCKIFCDVVDIEYAKKVEKLGADAIIAVNSGAGGHAGKIPLSILVPLLKQNCSLPIISAGGVGDSYGLLSSLSLGAEGVSVGSPFIATWESNVTSCYKETVINNGANDIVLSTKISGSPCTVINTDYVKTISLKQNPIEQFIYKNKKIKKYAKALTYYKGMKLLSKAALTDNYKKNIFCAGPSIEFTTEQLSVEKVVNNIIKDFDKAKQELLAKF